MKKLVIAAAAALLALTACGAVSDEDQVRSLQDRTLDALQGGDISRLAAMSDPSCSAEVLGMIAVAKAYGIDIAAYLKEAARDLQVTGPVVIDGPSAWTGARDHNPDFVKIDGKWWLQCSDVAGMGIEA